jgi:hypothetical protein
VKDGHCYRDFYAQTDADSKALSDSASSALTFTP